MLMKDGKTQAQIVKLTEWHKSTISRKLARNTGLKGCCPKQACLLAEECSLGSLNAARINPVDWDETVDYVEQKCSPEQVTNHVGIGHETIYSHVYANKVGGDSPYQQLRCQKKHKKRYANGHDWRGQMVGRSPISEGPAHIEARPEIDPWEGDTALEAHYKQAIVTLADRKSGCAFIAKLNNKTSDLVSAAIINRPSLMEPPVKTITFDNGKEFAKHSRIDTALKSTAYFVDPSASWQRGSNENFNGLLRQYIPKKRLLSTVTNEALRMFQAELNSRPRKRLGFNPPMRYLCSP